MLPSISNRRRGQGGSLLGMACCTALAGLSLAAAAASQTATAPTAQALEKTGAALEAKGAYAAAQAAYSRAIASYQGAGDTLGVARTRRGLAIVDLDLGDYAQARTLATAALAVFMARGDAADEARALLVLAHDQTANPAARLAWVRQALALALEVHDAGSEGSARESLGDDAFSRGDFASAIGQLDYAVLCFQRARSPLQTARAYTSLGRVYRAHGYPARARALYRRALALQRRYGDAEGAIQSMNAIAVSYEAQGRYRDAVRQFQRTLAAARPTASPRIIAFLEDSLGAEYVNLGQDARALDLLLRFTPQEHGSSTLAYRYASIAHAELDIGQPNAAIAAATRSLAEAEQSEDRSRMLHALYWRARAEAGAGGNNAALADTRQALELLALLHQRLVPTDAMKIGFADQYRWLTDFAVALFNRWGYADQGFAAAEAARARAFADLLGSRYTPSVAQDQSSVRAATDVQARLERAGIVRTAARGLVTRGAASAASGESPSGPASPTITAALSVAQTAALAARLRSVVLAFWCEPDATYGWIVGPEGLRQSVRIVVSRADLQALIARTAVAPAALTQAALAPTSAQRRAWRELDRLLIAPFRSSLPAPGALLTIVPDGPLFRLSFAALQDPSGQYLVQRYALAYAPSATALALLAGAPSQPRRPFLLVADPKSPSAGGLPPLPAARREVAAVARLLPAGDATLDVGRAAGHDAVVRAMGGDYRVLHLATHAIVNDADGAASFIALGGAQPATADLTVAQIYRLRTHAELVFLSACRTARGPITGDGIVGLSRAFFYAGTPTVIASLWDVADQPTAVFVAGFYRHFLAGEGKAKSLRAAQLDLLRRLRAGQVQVRTADGNLLTLPENPVFWAGFTLTGQP